MIFKRTLALLLVLLSTSGSAFAAHRHHHTQDVDPVIGMVTGPKTGTYIAFGHDIAEVAKQVGLIINVYESGGSIDNIQRITSKEKVGLAIVQSDVLGFLSRSKSEDSIASAKKLRMIAPFYNEEVHVLARKDIASFADLAGKRVVVGSAGSGSMITAVNIFSTLGVRPSKLYEIDPPHGVIAVLDGEVDAVIFVGGKPVKMFKNMEELANITQGANAGKLDQVHFLALNDARLLKEYKPATLTHAAYSYVTDDVPTVAVTAVLVDYDYTMKDESYYRQQCRNMAKLAGAIRDNMDYLRAHGHPKWKEVDLSTDVGIWKRDVCSAKELSSSPDSAESAPAQDHQALEKDLLGIVRGGGSGQ